MLDHVERRCVFCQNPVERWVPYASRPSPLIERIKVVGTDVDRFGCPKCGAYDRERHLQLYLDRFGLLSGDHNARLLHFAPEPILGPHIRRRISPRVYFMGDLIPSAPKVVKLDVQQIPFRSESFSMIICNHVLEHVYDPNKALREMFRTLGRGGRLICQTPFSTLLSRTLEESFIITADDREFFYGQEDHRRLFGSNIAEFIRGFGFMGQLIQHRDVLSEIDGETFGVNEDEPFFDFVKPN
jgi:SAM-dependent methyltransferase